MSNKYHYPIFALSVLIGALVYRAALTEVITAVLNREGSSHGFFIPALTAYFLWIKRESILNSEKKYETLFIPLALLLLIVPPLIISSPYIQFIIFVFYIASVSLTVLGKTIFKLSAFPILFLIVMTPVNDTLYVQIGELSRVITYHLSVGFISLIGIPNYSHNWYVQLPNANLYVDLGCSGVRYLISYFVFGIAYAYIFKTTIQSRLFFVALTIPFSLVATTARLTTIYLLTYFISPKMAEYYPHLYTSWIVFAVFLFGGIALDQVVSQKGKQQEILDADLQDERR